MLVTVFAVVLTLGVILLVYTYVGYPLALLVLGTVLTSSDPTTYDQMFPSVTMVVPVHNEENVIREKVANTRELVYPGQMACLFVSDSNDRTNAILQEAASDCISFLSLDRRRGKSHAINQALETVDSDIVVFSDANTMYEPDALRHLVAPLADDRIGCVTGNLRLLNRSGETSEGAYWRYELQLRRLEARLGTTVSVNGGVLAFRRADLSPLPKRALTDDFVLAMRQVRQGYRVHYEPAAVASEYTTGSVLEEFTRRVRIGAGNYQSLAWFPDLLVPTDPLVTLEYVSHKVLRWLGPWLLLIVFIATLGLAVLAPSPLALALLLGQVLAALLAGAGLLTERARGFAPVRAVTYFLVMNAALGLGCLRAIRGTTHEIWSVTERTGKDA